jgi:c-di-GMP-binding flagellar brake protein YcgR
MDAEEERRKKRRYGVRGSVVRYKKGGILSFINPSSPKYLVINISELGLSFMTKEKLNEGEQLALSISAPKLEGTIRARGKVTWVKKSEEFDAYRVGADFTSLEGRSKSLLKNMLDSAILDSIDITTKIYLKEIEKL